MNRKLTGAALLPAAAWLAMLCACPSSQPPGGDACADEGEACAQSSDCCNNLTCDEQVCRTPPAACVEKGEPCGGADDCCDPMTCVDEVCVTSCAAEGESCTGAEDCCEQLVCEAQVCATPGAGNVAALPAKSIAFDLLGVHDSESGSYDGNCTAAACHGDRTEEVALDGVTPSAHATMLTFFGGGNDRCIACHNGGPDFLTLSAGSLREQVDMDDAGCANCHGASSTPAFYASGS